MQKILNLTPHLKEVIQRQTKNIHLFQDYYDVIFDKTFSMKLM